MNELKIFSARNNSRLRLSNRTMLLCAYNIFLLGNRWKMGENGFCFYHNNFEKKVKKCVGHVNILQRLIVNIGEPIKESTAASLEF